MPITKRRLIPGILILLAMISLAAPPLWWSQGNSPVITGASENNKGPANIGQAKNMVSTALQALDTHAPTIATQIRADLAISHPDLLTIPDPKDAVWIEKQKAPLLIGQLKAISAPFYTRLNTANSTWLATERTTNGTHHPDSIFPWTTEINDDANQAIATIGQLKAVFSLRFESLPLPFTDEDGDRMDDNWEIANGLDPTDPDDADYDYDEDSISNLYEYLLGSDPWNDSTNGTPDVDSDRDGDGMSDYSEALVGEWTWNSTLERDVFVRRLDWEIDDANGDPDADGLGNYAELLAGTDPFNTDSDGDGMPDGWEVVNGFDPKDSTDASEDSDSDGLTNGEEQQFGTAPKNSDADGDGMIDSLEIAAGTDSENQDSDGDGIPDSIDSQPLVSSLAFTDADGDGIPDSADPAPNNPRGTAPSISSETAPGNPVSNLIKDDTVKLVFMVSNPSGPAPTASNLTFLLNGTEDAAETTSITAIGSPVGSSQRFLLTWLAKTTANYPALTLQNLTLRFQDAQQATSSINLARIDVAEWEGMIAGIPEHGVGLSTEAWVANVASHLNGRLISPFEFAGSGRVSVTRYRGPRVVKLLDADGRTEKGAATIPQGVRYPLVFITRNSNPLTYTASRIVDISSPYFMPSRCVGYLNQSSLVVRMTIANGDMEITPGDLKFNPLPDREGDPHTFGITGTVMGQTEFFYDRSAEVPASQYSRRLLMGLIENTSPTPEGLPSAQSSSNLLFIDFEKSITPHSAGSLEYPGLPQPPKNLETPELLPMSSDQWHKIILKAGPDTAAVSNGIGLWLRKGENGDAAPQATGFTLKVQGDNAALEDLSVPPEGKILLAAGSANWQRLTSPSGLTVFIARDGTVTDTHDLSLQILKKHEWQPQEAVKIASIDLVSVDITAVFGIGPSAPAMPGASTSRASLESYLDTVKFLRSGDLWLVHGKTNTGVARFYCIEVADTEERLLAALGSRGRTVIFDGHANFGIGPNFSLASFKSIADFTNFGVNHTDIPLAFRGDGSEPDPMPYLPPTGQPFPNDPNTAAPLEKGVSHLTEEGWAYLVLQPDEAMNIVPNYNVPHVGELRYKNDQGKNAAQSFEKIGEGFNNEWHYSYGGIDEKRLIVKAPQNQVPQLRYDTFFYNACDTGVHFIENFEHGNFVYTKSQCIVQKATSFFVRSLVEGKTSEQATNLLDGPLNADERPNIKTYDIKSF